MERFGALPSAEVLSAGRKRDRGHIDFVLAAASFKAAVLASEEKDRKSVV